MSRAPSKPGYYWAKHKRRPHWNPVELFQIDESNWVVFTLAEQVPMALSDFTFGPEIVKPDGLEES